MKKHIPNLITSLNVVSGTAAVFMILYGRLQFAAAFVLLAMIFDFFDGFAARLLHVKSEVGKELDSLADMVSFGLVPALLAHALMIKLLLEVPQERTVSEQILLFVPLLIPAFSAYRLAKFNLDVRQTTSFIGMPTPANALFWVGLVFGAFYTPDLYASLFGNIWVLAVCAFILSLLLVSGLPMFSLKVSGFGWAENKVRYSYFFCLILVGCIWGKAVLLFIIPLYILFAAGEALLKSFTTSNH